MICDDDHIVEYQQDAKYLAKHRDLQTVACAFFGTFCTKVYIVPVPIHHTNGEEPRAVDLVFQCYTSPLSRDEKRVYNVDNFMDEITPLKGQEVPFRLTMFKSTHPLSSFNILIESLIGAECLLIRGPVLVTKTDLAGVLAPVTEEDLHYVERALVSHLNNEKRIRLGLPETVKTGFVSDDESAMSTDGSSESELSE